MTAQDILDIVKAFFDAILKVLKALGLDFGSKDEPSTEATGE